MATQVQYRRGTNAQNAAFTGALGEITVDTTNGTIRVHNGVTTGGSNIATVSYVSAQIASLSSNSITDGTSNVKVFNNGNVAITVGGTANVGLFTSTGLVVTGDLSVTGNATLTGNILGDRIQNGTTQIDIQTQNGNANITVAGTSNVAVFSTGGLDITGNIGLSGNLVDTGALTIATGSNGNITLSPNGTGVVVINTDLRNGQANGVGNIGSATTYFNTVFAKATSAQYADLAEIYQADSNYEPGTVVVFGGDQEITITDQSHDTRVAGVISTDPAFIMNSHAQGLPVAFTGRVPCRVQGPVNKGDVLVTSSTPGVAQRIGVNWQPGCILGKSLDNITDNSIQTIEVVVGRF